MQSLNDIRKAYLDFFASKEHTVIPSSPLVPHNDPTLMFTNAGMVPFKNVFIGAENLTDKAGKPVKRATSSQKCVRAGGKHNDLDNVGYTARHHTFFEMLGNFSFADYFKEGAISYAWELVTKIYGLPKDKLLVTVYHTDDEAFNLWKKIAGLPEAKIIRIPTNDNFWAMGDTGPCGPCSEIFFDHGELASGEQIALPKPCIDTGMGLERTAAVLQGKHDNYAIDLFQHLIEFAQNAVGKQGGNTDITNAETHASYKVLADHLRSTSFLIADGVTPSNEGRGYVLRRIMRRAMRHAHILGCKDPLMFRLFPSLLKEMGGHYPELGRAQALITETLKTEEERFKETLGRGLKLLEEETASLGKGSKLSGEIAFKLYDTFGFPLDLTQDILRSRALEVDLAGFDAAMAEQKKKARAAWSGSGAKATDTVWFDIKEKNGATEFLGYDTLEANGQVVALVKEGVSVTQAQAGDNVSIVTNQTPFYGESGGQAGDKGTITTQGAEIEITDTQKMLGALHVHNGVVKKGSVKTGEVVQLHVDGTRRDALRANHSATHLLHAVLRKILGPHVTQKGSLVEANYFRFDFSHGKAIEKDILQQIEDEVNKLITEKTEVGTRLMTPDEAVAQGAMALFGEKYGEEVRVVNMGGTYSVELCGGTHVKNTGDIQKFKITRESSVAAGIRRIEARTAQAVDAYNAEQAAARASEEKRKAEQAQASQAAASQLGDIQKQFVAGITKAETIGNVKFYGRHLDGVPGKDLRGLVDAFKKEAKSGVVAIVATSEGKASVVVGVTDDLTAKLSAVELVKKGSEALGGKGGGGRPDFAQAGGPDATKADEAISSIRQSIAG
ncbi:MAG: alanine--tRNA ligase [Proteobacteria bacterium]|nr:alanine--tRNA ligase [Pseudomonadota bacterium]